MTDIQHVTPHHACAAKGCRRIIPANRFMCPAHWRRVPQRLRLTIWTQYRRGMRWLTRDVYRKAAARAIEAVAMSEARKR